MGRAVFSGGKSRAAEVGKACCWCAKASFFRDGITRVWILSLHCAFCRNVDACIRLVEEYKQRRCHTGDISVFAFLWLHVLVTGPCLSASQQHRSLAYVPQLFSPRNTTIRLDLRERNETKYVPALDIPEFRSGRLEVPTNSTLLGCLDLVHLDSGRLYVVCQKKKL